MTSVTWCRSARMNFSNEYVRCQTLRLRSEYIAARSSSLHLFHCISTTSEGVLALACVIVVTFDRVYVRKVWRVLCSVRTHTLRIYWVLASN